MPAATASLRILVVEDDRAHGQTIAEVLEGDGHRVELAVSGAEALSRLEAGDIELVVTDLRLQDADGLTIVEKCAELRGEHAVPQVVVVTGYGTVEGAVAAMRAGAVHYLQKPSTSGSCARR